MVFVLHALVELSTMEPVVAAVPVAILAQPTTQELVRALPVSPERSLMEPFLASHAQLDSFH